MDHLEFSIANYFHAAATGRFAIVALVLIAIFVLSHHRWPIERLKKLLGTRK